MNSSSIKWQRTKYICAQLKYSWSSCVYVMLITDKDGGVYNALRKSTRRSHMDNKVGSFICYTNFVLVKERLLVPCKSILAGTDLRAYRSSENLFIYVYSIIFSIFLAEKIMGRHDQIH